MEFPGVSLAWRGEGRPCHGMGRGYNAQADRLNVDIITACTIKLFLVLRMFIRRRRRSQKTQQKNAQTYLVVLMLEMQYGCWVRW